MSKISYKSLFIIFFFLLIAIVILSRFLLPKQKVSAAWWNDSWNYRQAINISSHTTSESNVYIIATVNIGSTTKSQTDNGDFRFVTQSGDILPYYISAGTGTTAITFHIQFTSFPSGAQTIYAYYGNSSVTNGFSASNFSTQASNYSIGSYSSEEAGGGPIAYWKFDEGVGTTTIDSSGNSNTGTITGATWATEDLCISGKCLNFSGSGSPNIAVSTNNSLNFGTENFTISAWALNRDYTYPKSNFMIKKSAQCYTDGSANSGFDIGHGYVSNGINICLRDTLNNYIRTNLVFNDGFQPSQLINKWTHYAFIFDRTEGKIKVYINGIKQSNEIDISTITGNINNNSNLVLGTLYGWQTDGLYDDIKIYPYARTATQIKQDYNSRGSQSGSSANLGVKSSTAPDLNSKLVAYYKFNEKSGTTIYDSSGHNVTGTISGAKWAPITSGIGLSFGGYGSNNYVGLSQSPLDNATTWSITTKLKYRNFAKTFEFFLGKTDQTTGKILLGHSGYVSFRATNGTYYDFPTTSAEIDNIDSYLSFISDGTNIKLYINGIYKSLVTPASTSITVNTIGNAWTDTVWTSAFLIDELKLYDSTLSPSEILLDYNQNSSTVLTSSNQTTGGTTTSLDYCIPGDTSYCANPIAEWNFEENIGTTTYDTSGNNYNLNFNNGTSAPTWTVGKKNSGSGLLFNGTSNWLSSTIPSVPTNFSISAWIKLNILNREQHFAEFNGTQFYISSSNKLGTASWSNASGSTSLVANKWYFATLTRDSSEVKLYLDGKYEGIGTSGLNPTSPFMIGDLYNHSGNYKFNGSIDNVRVYNYIRTPAQIAYDYNKGAPVGWWKLDECQGSIAYDSSGLGNTGVISIASGGNQNALGTCQIGTSAAWTAGASGKINASLNFDGTDDQIAGSFTAIGITKPFTMSTWFKTSTSFAYQPGIVSLGYSPVIVMKTDGKIRAWWYNGSTWPGIESSQALNDNKWHYITLTYNGSTAILYIDGIYQSTLSSDIHAIYSGFYIGQEHNSGAKYFNGQIDDVRIYNYALTPDQVKTVYNNGAVNFN